MKLPKLCKETCWKYSNLNIFFTEITEIKYKNCKYKIIKEDSSVALYKEGCNIDQDVELFFKD